MGSKTQNTLHVGTEKANPPARRSDLEARVDRMRTKPTEVLLGPAMLCDLINIFDFLLDRIKELEKDSIAENEDIHISTEAITKRALDKQREEFVKDLESELPDKAEAIYEAEAGLGGLLAQREVLQKLISKYKKNEE